MFEIKLIDSNFSHHPYNGTSVSTSPNNNLNPTDFKWYRGNDNRDVTVFTDNHIDDVLKVKNTFKVAWILEPKQLVPSVYEKIRRLWNEFDLVLTHDYELIDFCKNPKVKFIPFGGCWIQEKDFKVYDKTKNVSAIFSPKRQLEGHAIRHDVISKFGNRIEGIFGGGYKYLVDKVDGMKDYRFHLAIENVRYDSWFTEKLVDCFATGSLPIYWGCSDTIGKFFNKEGMICFDNVSDLYQIFDQKVNQDFYQNCMEAIKENFEISKKYRIMEDIMFDWHLKEIVK